MEEKWTSRRDPGSQTHPTKIPKLRERKENSAVAFSGGDIYPGFPFPPSAMVEKKSTLRREEGSPTCVPPEVIRDLNRGLNKKEKERREVQKVQKISLTLGQERNKCRNARCSTSSRQSYTGQKHGKASRNLGNNTPKGTPFFFGGKKLYT